MTILLVLSLGFNLYLSLKNNEIKQQNNILEKQHVECIKHKYDIDCEKNDCN